MPCNRKACFAALCCLVLMLGTTMHGQSPHASKVSSAEKAGPQLLPGIVVEKIEKNSEADKAGLREGDVLLSWSRGDVRGALDSPFEQLWFNFQMPIYAPLVFEGYRGGTARKWKGGFYSAGLTIRPNFGSRLLSLYRESLRSAVAIKADNGTALSDGFAASGPDGQPPWLRSWFLLHVAEAHTVSRRWNEADLFYDAASRAAEELPEVKGLVLAYWAKSFQVRQDLEHAIKYYELALPGTRLMASRKSISEKRPHLAGPAFCASTDDMPDLPRQDGDPQSLSYPSGSVVSTILDLLGAFNTEQGNLEQAEQFLLQERRVSRQLGTSTFYGLNGLAGVAFSLGNIQTAEQYFRAALSSCHMGRSTSLASLALIAEMRGNFARAEQLFRKGMAIYYRRPFNERNSAYGRLWLALTLSNLGLLAEDEGNYGAALEFHRKALTRYKDAVHGNATQANIYLAQGLTHLGDILQKGNRLREAERYLLQALELGAKVGPNTRTLAWTLNDLGNVYFSRGDLAQAEKFYRQALAIRRDSIPGSWEQAEVLALLGKTLKREGQMKEAIASYDQALDALAVQAARMGGDPDARSGFRGHHGGFYTEYVELLVETGNPDAAYSVLERSRARALLEVLATAQLDLRRGVAPALLERERSLRGDIKAKSDRRARLMGENHSDEQLKAIEDEISELLLQQQDVEAQIRATSPAYAALTQPQPLTASEVQTQLLDDNTLLLEYSLGEERSYVFAVTPDSLQAFELPKRAVLEKASRRVYSLLTARNITLKGETEAQKQSRIAQAEAQYPRAAAELSRMILGPVTSQLQSKRLLIVTDGALAYIPFSVLPEPRNTEASSAIATLATAIPLMVNHEIVNLPSASVLAVLRQQELGRKPAPKSVAVLADPVFDRHDSRLSPKLAAASFQSISQTRSARAPFFTGPLLDPPSSLGLLTRSAADVGLSRNGELRLARLPFSRREAEEIMAVTPQGEGKEAVDFDASRATATSPELSQYRIVHFATHGLLDSVHPELSGLVFSMVDKNGRPQNGFLELQDIYNLNLPADLVVLSACETGLGKEISGEGLVGLTRGFMYAGASRVMASLWKVSDAGTAALMAEFYRALEKDNLPPAAALRAAQIKMWRQKRWRNPYYWAAFQLQGEWK